MASIFRIGIAGYCVAFLALAWIAYQQQQRIKIFERDQVLLHEAVAEARATICANWTPAQGDRPWHCEGSE